MSPQKIIESRYWISNLRINNQLTTDDINNKINLFTKKESAKQPAEYFCTCIEDKLFTYESRKEIRITYKTSPIGTSQDNIPIDEIVISIGSSEIIGIYSFLSSQESRTINQIENQSNTASNHISSLIENKDSIIRKLINHLKENNVLEENNTSSWGVAGHLAKDKRHSMSDTYLFCLDCFVDNLDALSIQNIKTTQLTVQNGTDYINVHVGWAINIWETTSLDKDTIIDLIRNNTLAYSMALIYDNARNTYAKTLEDLLFNKKIASRAIRNTINLNHILLHKTMEMEPQLQSDKNRYYQTQTEYLSIGKRRDFFKSSEQALLREAEGIENQQGIKNGNKVRILVAAFTSLSVYSIANDIYSIATNNAHIQPLDIYNETFRSFLVFASTMLFILLIVIQHYSGKSND